MKLFKIIPMDIRPAKNLEGSPGEGLIEDRLPIIKKAMLEGRSDNPNYIVILVGPAEETFVVNQGLLKLSSRRWEKLIKEKEADESNDMLIFPKILPKDFQAMLEYAILEMPWTFLNLKETCGLIETSFQFGLYNFVEGICESVLLKVEDGEDGIFDDEDSMAAFLLRSFGFESLRQKSLEYILENASPILEGNHFLRLSLEDFGEILIQDKLKVESEVKVLNALIRWGMNVLKNENKLSSPEILSNVLVEPLNWIRFPNMSELELQNYVIPLEILTDEQVEVMTQWHENGGSISAFNKDPREYLEVIDMKEAAELAGKSLEEFLHESRLKNLLADLDIEEGFHNMEIEARKSKIQARELANKCEEYAKLERKVQQMESVFTWEKIMEAIRFYQKLETLRKRFENNRANTIDSQNIGINFDVWETLAEKIRKGEDLRELVAEIEEPESIDLQLLESVNEGVENKIIELQKVKSQEIYEPLSWKIFQKESESALAELQKFENTKTYACAIIFKNNTSETLRNFQTFIDCGQLYIALPWEIQPFCTHNFGQTHSDLVTYGLISYDIGTMRIVLRHYFNTYYNDFGIAIAPLTFSTNNLAAFNDFALGDWTNDSTKVKTLCTAPTKVEACVKLGNLSLHTELIGTGPKAVLRVLVTAI